MYLYIHSHFAFYNESEQIEGYQLQDVSHLTTINYGGHYKVTHYHTHTQYYTSDAFGLQTLDKAGKIFVHEVPGVEHVDWHGNKDVFNNFIKPYLD